MTVSMLIFAYVCVLVVAYLLGKKDGWDEHCLVAYKTFEEMKAIRNKRAEEFFDNRRKKI